MNDPKHTLQTAQRAEADARGQLDLERQRVTQGEQEVSSLQSQLKLENPDERKVYQKLVAALAEARLRLDALRERIPAAEEAVRVASEDLALADRKAARVQLAELQAQREQEATELVHLGCHLLDEFNARHEAFKQGARTDEVHEIERRAGESLPGTDVDNWSGMGDAITSIERRRAYEAAERAYVESGRAARDAAATAAQRQRQLHELELQRLADEKFGGRIDVAEEHLRVQSLRDVRAIDTQSQEVCDAQ